MDAEDSSEARPGALVFALLFVAFSGFLLSQLPGQAKFSAKGNLVAEPAFWPAVGVIGMTAFGALHLLGTFRRKRPVGSLAETGIWMRSIEYLTWFMVYVFAVPVIGYLPATLIFTVLLALRAGYRNHWMLGAAAFAGLGIVLVFKTFLSVKIPGGAVYDLLPSSLRSFLIVNF